ncbi:hypothetical protein LTR05_005419 [Lithohypha guttulata]|uniref:Uncharacterized protein n=1 Tax=Lithohypha guttulata TaxID=1690604 RepID=A0AAN7YFX0_9EURO|nr:hypothetical protein LTR05_005419 [Lithohypha guttulata]
MSSYMWIERGSDGRPYYVMRKPAVPSLRQKIAEAFRELRQRPQVPTTKPASAPSSPQLPPAPANTPASHSSANNKEPKSSLKQKPQAHPEMARSKTPIPTTNAPNHANFQGQFSPYHHLPFVPPFSPPPIHHENIPGAAQNPLSSAVVPHYNTPHPRMYPYVPAGTQALSAHGPAQHMNMPAMHHGGPNTISQASQPPNMFAPVPHGQNLVNPLHLNADNPRHKCSNCGRSRSARYRWKHQLTLGGLPGPSICRRCRKEVTDSEEKGIPEVVLEREANLDYHHVREASGRDREHALLVDRTTATLTLTTMLHKDLRIPVRRATSLSHEFHEDERVGRIEVDSRVWKL